MKYSLTLAIVLAVNWLIWSGHFESPFLLTMGGLSVLFCLLIGWRMRIIDSEGAPAQLGVWPFVSYAPWLARQVMRSNLQVAKIILSPRLRIRRNLVRITTYQATDLGRVILANSITLTPGTVSIRLTGDKILVHGLLRSETDLDLRGEMDRRICALERAT